MKKILFIGAGNMGCAILKHITSKPYEIYVQDPSIEHIIKDNSFLQEKTNVKLFDTLKNISRVCCNFDYIFLAVKPQMINEILPAFNTYIDISSINTDNIIISILAGKSVGFFQQYFGKNAKIVRAMPNLGALQAKSLTGFFASPVLSIADVELTSELLKSFGEVIKLPSEEQINRLTAIAGSGPAYVFYFAEILVKASINMGFDKQQAEKIAEATLFGASSVLYNSGEDAIKLRQKVTSKNGTTEAGLKKLMQNETMENLLQETVNAAYERACELSASKY